MIVRANKDIEGYLIKGQHYRVLGTWRLGYRIEISNHKWPNGFETHGSHLEVVGIKSYIEILGRSVSN